MVTEAEQKIIDSLNKSNKESLTDKTPVPEQVPQVQEKNELSENSAEKQVQKEASTETKNKKPTEEEVGTGVTTKKNTKKQEQHSEEPKKKEQEEVVMKSPVKEGITTITVQLERGGEDIKIDIKKIECTHPRHIRKMLNLLKFELNQDRKQMTKSVTLQEVHEKAASKPKEVKSSGQDRVELRGIGEYLGDPSRDHVEPPIPAATPKHINPNNLAQLEGDVIASAQESNTEGNITSESK